MSEVHSDPPVDFPIASSAENASIRAKSCPNSPNSSISSSANSIKNEEKRKRINVDKTVNSFTQEAMGNLGYTNADLRYPKEALIEKLTSNPKLAKKARQNLNKEVDIRKDLLEKEKKRLFDYYNSNNNNNRNFFADSMNNSNSGSYYIRRNYNDFDLSVSEEPFQKVVDRHKKQIEDVIFNMLLKSYQNEKIDDVIDNRNEHIYQCTADRHDKNENERKKSQQFVKLRNTQLKERIGHIKDKINQDDQRSVEKYFEKLGKVDQRSAQVRSSIDRAEKKHKEIEKANSIRTNEINESNQNRTRNAIMKKEEMKLEFQIRFRNKTDAKSARQTNSLNNVQWQNKIHSIERQNQSLEKEVRHFSRLGKAEEDKVTLNRERNLNFTRKQNVIKSTRIRQLNERRQIQEKDDQHHQKSVQNLIGLSEEYRQFLIDSFRKEEMINQRLSFLREESDRKLEEEKELLLARDWLRSADFERRREEENSLREEKKLQNALRNYNAQCYRKIGERREHRRRSNSVNVLTRRMKERDEMRRIEMKFLRDERMRMKEEIEKYERVFQRQLESAKNEEEELGRLAAIYEIDIDRLNEMAREPRKGRPPVPKMISEMRSVKNIDLEKAKSIVRNSK